MKIFILVCLTFLNFALFASETKKVVFIGDSITEGYGVTHDQAYPALIQQKSDKDGKKWQVINAGISGSTTASASSRVGWVLKETPALIVLALGANDGLRGVPAKTMEQNLTRAVLLCKRAKVKVLLVGMRLPPNYGVEYGKAFAQVFPSIAKAQGVSLMPFLLEGIGGHPDLNQEDGIHPTAKGQAMIADNIYSYIKKLL